MQSRLIIAALLLFSLIEPGSYAETGHPASPMGVPARPAAPAPAVQPSMIPYAAPEPQPTPTTTMLAPPSQARPIGCEEACASSLFERAVFGMRVGTISEASHVRLQNGESLDIVGYARECPHSEGTEKSVDLETIPSGCIFVFHIPSSRAPYSATRAKHALRCTGGRIGMSPFRCDESTSSTASLVPPELARE